MEYTQQHPIIGVWEVNAPGAPFPWHMMSFTPYGTVSQSNPPAGNTSESDSIGQGIWKMIDKSTIEALFVEIKADHTTGAYIGKGKIQFTLTVQGDSFQGTAKAYVFDTHDQQIRGPLDTPLVGKRVTFESIIKGVSV